VRSLVEASEKSSSPKILHDRRLMSETQNARSAAVTLGGLFEVVDPVGASGKAGLHADATNARAITAKVPLAEVAGLTDRSRAGRGSPPQLVQVFPPDLMVPADLSRFGNESASAMPAPHPRGGGTPIQHSRWQERRLSVCYITEYAKTCEHAGLDTESAAVAPFSERVSDSRSRARDVE
jgi:hypothetical protein